TIMVSRVFFVALVLASTSALAASPPVESPVLPDPTWLGKMRSLALDERVGAALDALEARDADITEWQIRLAEIPAPDFPASERGAYFSQVLRGVGLDGVRRDAIGNVMGVLHGADSRLPAVVLSAHLDTVFPELGQIHVQHEGTVLRAPGVGDDA